MSHTLEVSQYDRASMSTTPMTEEELTRLYGAHAQDVIAHKVQAGLCQEDPNLPGARVFLMTKEVTERGMEDKWRCLAVHFAARSCLWAFDKSHVVKSFHDQERLFILVPLQPRSLWHRSQRPRHLVLGRPAHVRSQLHQVGKGRRRSRPSPVARQMIRNVGGQALRRLRP